MTEFKKKPLLYKLKQFYFDHLYDYTHGFIAFKWGFRCKIYIRNLIFPYNVVKIDTLSKSYHDKDYILLHANFQILCDFFEKELPNASSVFISNLNEVRKDFEGLYEDKNKLEEVMKQEEKSNSEQIELMKIYFWWRSERPYREQNTPKIPDGVIREKLFSTDPQDFNEYGDPQTFKWNQPTNPEYLDWLRACGEYEAACEKEDDEKLIRLIQLRRYLWT